MIAGIDARPLGSRVIAYPRRSERAHTLLSLVLLAPDTSDAEHAGGSDADSPSLIGAAMREVMRMTDRAARFGPSLYAAILPATDAAGAGVFTERLRRMVTQLGGPALRAGISTFPENAVSPVDLMAEAESALEFARTTDLWIVSPTMLERTE